MLPGTNVGALIARIGDDGPVFAVGSRHDIIADRTGTLFLAMNEHPEYRNQAGKVVGDPRAADATRAKRYLDAWTELLDESYRDSAGG